MKFYIFTAIAVLGIISSMHAQNTISQPVDIGNKAFSFSYTDTKNTVNYTDDYHGQSSNDVYYKFTLTRAMDISIDHCGSGVSDTFVHLLSATGDLIDENDDDGEYEYCQNPMNSYLYVSNLPAGTYYVVSEGYSENGNITTTIKGISSYSEIGSSMSIPIQVGSKTWSFLYTDTKNTVDYINNYQGQPTNDVFYKFTITYPMDVIVNHCGSGLSDTFVHLLNVNGEMIDENDDDYDYGYCENIYNSFLYEYSLPAGTYYVVSEGYSGNGNITTSINGVRPLPLTGLYDGSAVIGMANSGQNYIQTITPTVATSDVSGLGVNESLQNIKYFDGLGRPIQTVQRGISPTKHDLATFTEYDGAGRNNIQWLPIPTVGNGALTPKSEFTSGSSVYGTDSRRFNETIYEPSAMNRIENQYGPGQDWADHPVHMNYDINNNDIAYYFVNQFGNLQRGSNFMQGMLYKTETKDEDGIASTEFKDKLGRVILKRSEQSGHVDTYYVYNDLGQLSYVVPPNAADILGIGIYGNGDDNITLKQFCYLYKYDERGNCVYKRLPGCGAIFMVYDKSDRLILSQDGNQRNRKQDQNMEWTAIKYDNFGRVTFRGIMYRPESDTLQYYQSVRNIFINELVVDNYLTNNFNNCLPLTLNYYDNYSFIGSATTLGFVAKTGFDQLYTSAKGLLTGTRTYILGSSHEPTISVIYYDYRGRIIQTRGTNHLSGFDYTYNTYNHSGQLIKNLKEHSISSTINTPICELYTYTYDHASRLLTTSYVLNNAAPVLLVDNSASDAYDELGRLHKKKRHDGTDAEEYVYNIRNMPTKILSGSFEENLYYNSNPSFATPCFNGNISYSTWKYKGTTKGYVYEYDGLNRLNYALGTNSEHQWIEDNGEGFGYDKQGNIKSLWRLQDGGNMDELYLEYNGNQQKSVYDENGSSGLYERKEYNENNPERYDQGQEFTYDSNGNVISDFDRNIVTIKYNILNLPEIIQFKNGNQIKNTYDAGGRKLESNYYTILSGITVPLLNVGQFVDPMYLGPSTSLLTGTNYIGNIEYSFSNNDYDYQFNLDKIYNSEGYTLNSVNPAQPIFYYYRKDHLGNTREVWCPAYSVRDPIHGAIIRHAAATAQYTQYYPSGLPWESNESDNPGVQNRKFNGKEFIEMHGYDTYDFGARGYYPAIGRFTSVDPLAELTPSISPYAYCKGNPVNAIDPTGMYSTEEWKKDNEYTDDDFRTIYKAPDENKENEIKKPDPINDLKEQILNFFGWDLNPDDPKDRKKIDEGSKNRVKAAEEINEVNKFLIVNGTLFFVGEGLVYCIDEFGGAILVRIVGKEAIQAIEAAEKSLIGLGRGSTGRTLANTLEEQLTMKEIIFNPANGEVISNMKPLSDPRWYGWRKMQFIKKLSDGTEINIHYVGKFENGILKAVDDFKFKSK